jgi:hypothetical protein
MTFDLDQYLLIDKAKKPAAAGEDENGILTTLRWCGIGGAIKELDDSNWYLKVDHRDADGVILVPAGHYAPLKHWQEKGVPLENLAIRDFETPHAAMEREFREETGYDKVNGIVGIASWSKSMYMPRFICS